jgi:threonine dehydrogenase-like Zn-dependent dehydrogenase
MRAVVVRGVGEVAVENVEDARIEAPTDILLRVTSSAICGTDLHIYEGRMGDVAGTRGRRTVWLGRTTRRAGVAGARASS